MASAQFDDTKDGVLRLTLTGALDVHSTGRIWTKVFRRLAKKRFAELLVDAGQVEYCDGAGVALLRQLHRHQERSKGAIRIEGLKPQFTKLMEMFDPGSPCEPASRRLTLGAAVETVGKPVADVLDASGQHVSLVGELFAKLLRVAVRPTTLRWRDTFLIAEKAGAAGVGITAVLGFLIGLILAFQSAVSLRQFGAEAFVADLVVISLFRELGPLITAFILASRTGSAFAAEIGTMKVNEEIDALTTMGIDTTQFLVVPRIIAAVAVSPLLTLFNLLAGLIGCGVVMTALGFPLVAYLNQIQGAADLVDLLGGLAKTLVFGALVAAIGCQKGLETGSSASAVGDAATRAVVTSIAAIVIADGVFAVLYYVLGI